jgi:hypothetical protein
MWLPWCSGLRDDGGGRQLLPVSRRVYVNPAELEIFQQVAVGWQFMASGVLDPRVPFCY